MDPTEHQVNLDQILEVILEILCFPLVLNVHFRHQVLGVLPSKHLLVSSLFLYHTTVLFSFVVISWLIFWPWILPTLIPTLLNPCCQHSHLRKEKQNKNVKSYVALIFYRLESKLLSMAFKALQDWLSPYPPIDTTYYSPPHTYTTYLKPSWTSGSFYRLCALFHLNY